MATATSPPNGLTAEPLLEADALLASLKREWPSKRQVSHFLAAGNLERVLSLYSVAMTSDSDDPAIPWNLSGALARLGLLDLAVTYRARAIRLAERTGHDELSDAAAYLALADLALADDQYEIARASVSQAAILDPADEDVDALRRRISAATRARRVSYKAGGESHEDSARKGKAVEHLVAATCILSSDTRLNVSTSLVDDEGVDLVFHERGSSTTLSVQVKSRSWRSRAMAESAMFRAQIRVETFRPRPDLFALFVAVDQEVGSFGPTWLIPSVELERAPRTATGRLRFAASAQPASRDRWSPFRVSRADLAARVLAELRRLDAARPSAA